MQEISVEDRSYEYSSGRDSVFRENYDSLDMAYTDNDFVTDPIKMIKSNLEAQIEKINKKKAPEKKITLPIINKINLALYKGIKKNDKVSLQDKIAQHMTKTAE